MTREEEYIFFNNLFDIYGELLTIKENEIYKLFYEEDLSLSEIANYLNISKSMVSKTIKTINKKLINYEEKLNFKKIKEEIIATIIDNKNIYNKINKIFNKK